MHNSIGIPSRLTIQQLTAINNTSHVSNDLAPNLGAQGVIDIPSPLPGATQPVVETIAYTNATTNNAMNPFYNVKPDKLTFKVSQEINPEGTPLNFFSDTSSFYADLRAKLPLFGHFDHLTFQDTFDLKIDKPEELERLDFKTYIRNGLPLEAFMQVYFTDEYFHIRDSLTRDDHIIIRQAPVDPTTYLPYPGMYGVKDTTFILDRQRMLNLKNVKKMIVRAVMHSSGTGQENVKLRANQILRLNFSAKAKVHRNVSTNK